MAKGDATASTPVECLTPAALKVAIDALNLASLNAGSAAGSNFDQIHVIPIPGRDIGWYVFKIGFAAA
jgi:hypothetical protein